MDPLQGILPFFPGLSTAFLELAALLHWIPQGTYLPLQIPEFAINVVTILAIRVGEGSVLSLLELQGVCSLI